MADQVWTDLMDETETAELLVCARKTLANQRSRREGPPYIRLSRGAIRYSRKAVLKWLDERTITPGDAA